MAAQYAVLGVRVRTQDPSAPPATAVAWSGGTVVAVGDDTAVRAACDARTHVINAPGMTVTPGLTDGHQHLFHGAELEQGVSLDRVVTLEQLRARIRTERLRVGPGAWIQGFSVEYAALEGARYHHDLLDEAAGDGPMLLISLDVHTAFANRHALRLAEVTGPVDVGAGGIVVCDENGPTGEFNEMPAMRLVMDRLPVPGAALKRTWYRQAIAAQNALGITAIHQMNGSLETLDDLAALEDEGPLDLRILVHHLVLPTMTDDEAAELITARTRVGRRWRSDGVKFMLDGVIDTGTAWLEEPDSCGAGREPAWSELTRFHRRIRQFHEAGFRIATHAIGDRAVREVLDGYAALPPRDDRRHRVEHIELVFDSLIPRFGAQSVTASMQPVHLRWLRPDLTDPWSQRVGPRRCEQAFRFGDLAASGALVVIGSDWPVAPYDPRMGFFAARHRRAPDATDTRAIGRSRPMTGQEVLDGYTRNAALAVGDDDSGLLRPGARADLVIWADDPVTCSPADVLDLPVMLTVSDGRVVHRAESLP